MNKFRENLLRAKALVEAEPESMINLARWQSKTLCGTYHCLGGLCATDSHFRGQGLTLEFLQLSGGSKIKNLVLSLFGPEAGNLFRWRWPMPDRLDEVETAYTRWRQPDPLEGSDRDVCLFRLNRLLDLYPKEAEDVS